MPTDSLEHHRRELDALYAFCRGARDAFELVVDRDAQVEAQLSELRSELRALSNRVEALTRGLAADGREHSVAVGDAGKDDALVVVDTAAAIPELLGPYLGTEGDVVEYRRVDGAIGYARAGDVTVTRRQFVPELRRKAAQP